jgi:hypothetical protein
LSAAGLASSALLLGIWVFWTHGGRAITAVGVYSFAFALFVGFAGLYLRARNPASAADLVLPLALAYFGHVLTWALFWSGDLRAEVAEGPGIDAAVARWATTLGASLLVVSSGLSARGFTLFSLLDDVAFVSAVILAVSILRVRGGGLGAFRIGIVGMAFVVYAAVIFQGFGRLTLGVLGLALTMAATHRFRGRLIKACLLSVTMPVLIWLATARVRFTAELNPDQNSAVTGFESVVSPLRVFGTLLDWSSRGVLSPAWGETFWAAAVAPVPRILWDDKPVGFGAELVPLLVPQLLGTGHSEAALFHGEWVYNFGLLGVIAMIPIVGLGLNWLDARFLRRRAGVIRSRRELLILVMLVVAAAGMADLVWAGTFTYVARSGFRLALLVVLLVLFTDYRNRRPRRAGSSAAVGRPRRASPVAIALPRTHSTAAGPRSHR